MGEAAAADNTETVFQHFRLKAFVLAGYGGALVPPLKVGQVVVSTNFSSEAVLGFLRMLSGFDFASFCTIDEVVGTPEKRDAYAQRHREPGGRHGNRGGGQCRERAPDSLHGRARDQRRLPAGAADRRARRRLRRPPRAGRRRFACSVIWRRVRAKSRRCKNSSPAFPWPEKISRSSWSSSTPSCRRVGSRRREDTSPGGGLRSYGRCATKASYSVRSWRMSTAW